MEPSIWDRRLRHLAWWPIPLLILAMGFFWAVDLSIVYEPPHLMMALNLLFMLPVALFVAYQTGRSFLLRGHPGLLWFSCGILFWGGAGALGGFLLPYGPQAVVTVHNILIGLAAICHLAGVVFTPWPRPALRWPEVWLAGAYTGVLTLMVVVVLETLSGAMPAFFIQGEGGTPLRQIVLGSAVALFVLTAILLMRNPGGTRSAFQYWYALALLLIAVGLFGVLIQSNLGGPLGWTGRFAQYLGSIYLMVAAVVGMRETRDWGYLLEAALGEATQRFKELLSRYELVLAGAQDAIWDWDVAHQRVHFSPQWKAMRGYTEDEVSDHESEWSARIHPDDAPRIFARLQEHFAGQTPVFAEEYRIQCKDGSWKWIYDRGLVQRDAAGQVVRMAGSESDITERKRAERQLFEAHERLNALMQALPVGVSFSDDTTCQHITGNPMLLAQFEMTPQDNVSASALETTAAGRRVRYFHQGQEIGDTELPLQRAVAEDRVIPAIELEVRLPSGRCWLAEVIGAPLHDAKNQTIGGLAVVMDISERKRLEDDLRRLATTDPLTGAFNRRYLLQVMETEISRAQRHTRPLSLIMFDLDHFKRINDHFGHDQGDAVLKNVAMLVRDRLRHTDIFVRWGGEEFMILAPETKLPHALALAETLQVAFRQSPIGNIGPVTASFGVAEYHPDETVDQWLKRVDDLVYQGKHEGRDHISYRT